MKSFGGELVAAEFLFELLPNLFRGVLTIEEADEEMLGFFEAEESPGEGVFDDEVRSSSVLLPAQDQVIANLEFAGIHLRLTSSLLGTIKLHSKP